MQQGIKLQVGKFSKINNCADWNKDVQARIFPKINKLCSTTIREIKLKGYNYFPSFDTGFRAEPKRSKNIRAY